MNWRPLSLIGSLLAVVAGCLAATPSLVPRAWPVHVLLVGVCMVVFYAVGAFVGWAYRSMQLPVAPLRIRTVLWWVLVIAGAVALFISGWLGRDWQAEQRELLGMPEDVPVWWIVAPLLGVVLAAVLLAMGRGIRWIAFRLTRLLGRRLPRRFATVIAVVATAALTWYVVSGLLVTHTLEVADATFALNNDDDKPGVSNPDSPYRSGGPESGLSWDSMGREGRAFLYNGVTADEIAAVTGDEQAAEPVRVFVGLKASESATRRAQLAVEDLVRLGGFDRSVLAVAGTTGSGWIDPETAASLEYATHGDVATVTTQYSYLPSWLSFLVDRKRAQSNGEELLTAIRLHLNEMPAEERPELFVYGESLGAYSTDSAFTSVEDMSTTTNGGLLSGPPSFDPTWRRLQDNRDDGSALWQPRYDAGALVRVASTEEEVTDPSLVWQTDNRIVYLVNSSDPIVAWTADHQEWLDPRGPDVSPQVQAVPVIDFLQASADMIGATSPPAGHGHSYDVVCVTAWSEVLGPPSLPEAEIDAIVDAVSEQDFS